MDTTEQGETVGNTALDRLWRGAFIAALRQCGTVFHACEAAGIGRQTAYRLRNADATFAAEWDAALADFADILEAEAVRRAKGTRELVVYQGKPCGFWAKDGEIVPEGTPGATLIPLYENRYADGLLMFTLRGFKPERYSPKQDAAGSATPDGTPAVIEMPANGRDKPANG